MKQLLTKVCLFVAFCICIHNQSYAQAGITASPTRLYFSPGEKNEQTIVVSNPNKDKELEVGISINDWKYDSLGNNLSFDGGTLDMSCAKFVKIMPGSYFTLAPGETRNISVSVSGVPETPGIPVKTAMLYLTQLNPGDAKSETGAAIKVTVRMGVKVYFTSKANGTPNMEISNFTTAANDAGKNTGLKLYVDNIGELWLNGTVQFDFLNKETGKKYSVAPVEFYSLPSDKRIFECTFPEGLSKGKYTATGIIKFGKNDELKIAELDFEN